MIIKKSKKLHSKEKISNFDDFPEYKANFLWPYEENSVNEAGYEFANSKTNAYQKLWWEILVSRIKNNKKC